MNKENKRTLKYIFNFLKDMEDEDIAIVFEGIKQSLDYVAKERFGEEDWEKTKKEHGFDL